MTSPEYEYELKKCSLRQNKDGTVIAFRLHLEDERPDGDPQGIKALPVGGIVFARIRVEE